jgi:F-type H+-transporting ATPase subunit gamma
MVAASKLRHAQARVQNSRPYFQILYKTITDIVSTNRDFTSAYLTTRPVKRSVYVIIAGDRGLAGGYNSNVLKLARTHMADKDVTVLPIGKKAVDYCHSHKIPLLTEQYITAADVKVGDCFGIAKQLCKAYLRGELDELVIAYTDFVSVLSQTPVVMPLLPLQAAADTAETGGDILYEPGSEEVFAAIVPEYVGGILYGALCESRAAEQAARRTAMDAATQNADEMIADLSLKFNQARQAAITQEITEIVAGS